MRRLADWCFNHRFVVLGSWLAVLVAAVFLQSSTGSNYSSGSRLSGTQSATAQNLLQHAAPSAAGDTERIVFATKGRVVTQPAVRARVQAALAKVAHLPNVSRVISPYSPAGAKQISRNRTVAFATVSFSKDAKFISASEATRFVNAARGSNGHGLQVDVLGDVAASTNPSSSSSTLLGVAAALVVLIFVFGSSSPRCSRCSRPGSPSALHCR